MQSYIIGLNSGTSFDGIDVALVKFRKNNLKPIFIDGFVYEYPQIIKQKIRHLIDVGTYRGVPLQTISQLNFLLGEIFADAALKMIKKHKLKRDNILLISSHGQTIYHHPELERISNYKIKSTLQIGESSLIADRIGVKTISNFRETDIAAGGQGAPLMPYLDWIFFNKGKNVKAVLNIGGIANVTITGNDIVPIAFDIGPGNALIDLISQKYFKKDFDKDGKLASKGKIFLNLISKALKDPYFKKKLPKSTGKEYFNAKFIQKYFSKIKRKEDKLATLTYFTAKAIHKSFLDFVFPKYKIGEIIVSGGGIKNKTLMKHLRKLLVVETPGRAPLLTISDKYGLPSKYKEAILFALLGYTCHLGRANNMPSCTGASKKVILGKIVKV